MGSGGLVPSLDLGPQTLLGIDLFPMPLLSCPCCPARSLMSQLTCPELEDPLVALRVADRACQLCYRFTAFSRQADWASHGGFWDRGGESGRED